jgi:hypothetical protein
MDQYLIYKARRLDNQCKSETKETREHEEICYGDSTVSAYRLERGVIQRRKVQFGTKGVIQRRNS